MSSNVGLSTPRGSGTSGYVQRNLSALRPRDQTAPYSLSDPSRLHKQRKPDADILEHERLRKIEVAVFELRDKLEEEGKLDEDSVDDKCEELRRQLLKNEERGEAGSGAGGGRDKLKGYQVHENARAKIEETERLRKALGIRDDYVEGGHWKRQEERLRESMGVTEGAGTRDSESSKATESSFWRSG